MITFFKIALFITITFTQQNFQLRQVYYHEGDNVCASEQSDYVKINFIFDHTETISDMVTVGVGCIWSLSSQFWSIDCLDRFSVELEDHIYFENKMIRRNPYGIKKEIYINTTLKSKKVHYHNEDYDCDLFGDSTVQHYNKKDGPVTSVFNVQCKKNYMI